MTLEDFELLCAINASKSNLLGWTLEQTALICEACSETNFEFTKTEKSA